jgi:hypothetical protein
MTPNNPTPGDELVERLERVAGRSIGFRHATDPDDRLMIRRGDVQAAVLALRTRDEAARSSTTGEVERAVRDVGSKTIGLDAACEIARDALQAKDHSHVG